MAIQVPINLATEPFRRDRPMLVASAAVGLLLVILLGVEVKTIVSERHDGADIHVTINRLNTQLRGHRRPTGQAERDCWAALKTPKCWIAVCS